MSWVEDLKKVVEINSFTLNKSGVDEVGNVFKKWLEELGFESKIFKRELIGNHLLFSSKKTDKDKILLLGHLDTVFAPGSFEGFKEDQIWVYGPGVCDMKGGNIVALEALRNVYESFGEVCDIDFLLVSDEETGSDDSKFLTQEIAKKYKYAFVFEAAGKNLEVVVGRKGIGTFKIQIEGKAAHAGNSFEKGIDANLELAYKLIKLKNLTNLEQGTTLNVGKIKGGIGANTISPSSELIFEIRYTKKREKERILKEIEKILNTQFVPNTSAKLLGNIQRDVMEPNQKQLELIKKMEKVSGFKIPSESRGGGSDANFLANYGVITIDGFGPFGDGDHTHNERALKQSFDQRIELVSKILKFHQKEGKLL